MKLDYIQNFGFHLTNRIIDHRTQRNLSNDDVIMKGNLRKKIDKSKWVS